MNTTIVAIRRTAATIALGSAATTVITASTFLMLHGLLGGTNTVVAYAVTGSVLSAAFAAIAIAAALHFIFAIGRAEPYIIPIPKTWSSTRRRPQ